MRHALSFLAALVATALPLPAADSPPNVVLIFCDDLGYADVGCFGAQGYETPNIDRLAKEGRKFTGFHVSSAVCSASRAALLTGCYHSRVGIHGALGPEAPIGLHPDEMTIAEVLKTKGYATGMVGKWHLGRPQAFLPVRQGFDEYFGLPYSNDMWPHHPEAKKGSYPELPLIEGDQVLETLDDQSQLTTRYTERAVKFIDAHHTGPFFLYLAHNMPHVPLYVSEKFKGKTKRGLFGDVIAEIDWSVGEVLGALEKHGLTERTLVIFTSDNGPWLSYGDHAGSSGPLREGKGTSWDGGTRVPCVMRWPGKIPAGTECAEPLMTIDVLPTLAKLAGAELPARKIDGLDVWPVLSGSARCPHEAYFTYYADNQLQSVLSGTLKLVLPHQYRTMGDQPAATGGIPGKYRQARVTAPELYDLAGDPGESKNLATDRPADVQRLLKLAEGMRRDLGDSLTNTKGTGVRAPGRVEK